MLFFKRSDVLNIFSPIACILATRDGALIADKVGKDKQEIFRIIKIYSDDSVSFYEFVQDINNNYTKEEKLNLIEFMWKMAFADNRLDVDEERLIRRLADLIKIKDIEVLKLKDLSTKK